VLGIRPEHVHLAAGGPLLGQVTLVEPMGNHQVVWLRCGPHLLSALVHDNRRIEAGRTESFALDAAWASLFDPASGRRLPA
jgi:multiple sugar transport system ATP-binding protein